MNTPGFTAEDSLYISSVRYNMTGSRFLAANAEIMPQLVSCPSLIRIARMHVANYVYAVTQGDYDTASFWGEMAQDILEVYIAQCAA